MRNNQAADLSSGAGDAEYFALFVPFEWSTGRWGIGPQINFPAESAKFGSEKWRYGFASAWLERVGDKVLTGVLVQQIWGKTDPNDPDRQVAQPITIQPVFNYSLKNGYYLNIGETAFSYNWDADAWSIPLGLRFGKVFITRQGLHLEPLRRDPKDGLLQRQLAWQRPRQRPPGQSVVRVSDVGHF